MHLRLEQISPWPGERPACLLDYFKKYDDFLMMVDESHVSLPQVRGMFNGDRARKQMLGPPYR